MRALPIRSAFRVRAGAAAALCAIACGDGSGGGAARQVPVLGSLPAFSLTDQGARPFGSDQLDGKVWVADFVFTNCPGMCPMLTSAMAALQRELARDPLLQDVRLVSISVDPERDTPAALAAYAARAGADPGRWFFLTGSRDAIWRLSREGFHLPVGDAPGGSEEPIFHTGKFVLADRQGRIRGYYDALEADEGAALRADLRRVAGEATPAGG